MDESYPKIESVKSLDNYKLLVSFRNGVVKIYDCMPLLAIPIFRLLRNKAFFRAVQVGQGGYGIFWNDELDLSESELWIQGQTVEAEALLPLSDSRQD
jgi:hypothetical protein